MDSWVTILKITHILNAILMAWPYYALAAVNQRASMGPPLGDRLDVYIESLIKQRTIACFVFQGVALVTGVALTLAQGLGIDSLISNPALAVKLFLLLLIIFLLSYIHFNVQPRIDFLFSSLEPPPSDDTKAQIGSLRLRRKRVASVCLFVVLTVSMAGALVWTAFPMSLVIPLTAVIAIFTYRAYKGPMKFGWF